eukprot:4896860-Amphidinium_carterae.1
MQEWGAMKPTMPGGTLPAIRLPDGTIKGESVEIAKHAISLAPEKLGCEKADRAADAEAVWEDDQSSERPWVQPPGVKSLDNCNPILNFFPVETAEERLGEGMCNLSKMASVWFKHIDEKLEGGPFLFGCSRPCHADFMVFSRMDTMVDLNDEIVEKEASETVKSYYQAMLALPA